MRSALHALFLAAAVALLAGCSDPMKTVIPSDMAAWDKELAPVVQKLPEIERKDLVAYIMRMKALSVLPGAKQDIPFGTTVGEAIAEQRRWAEARAVEIAKEQAEQARVAAEAAALKAKLEDERRQVTERLNAVVVVTLLAKRQLPADINSRRYSDRQEFKLGVKNVSEKQIEGVAGELQFYDVFEKKVGYGNFRLSETIAPGASITWLGGRDYNQFNDMHRTLWNPEEGKYTTRFIPKAVVFADGTKLEAPDLD